MRVRSPIPGEPGTVGAGAGASVPSLVRPGVRRRHSARGRRQPPEPEETEHWVPPDRLVLLSDNADFSIDSRAVGYFPVTRVLGPVLHHRPARRQDLCGPDTRTARWRSVKKGGKSACCHGSESDDRGERDRVRG
jgi:hypothetical protein